MDLGNINIEENEINAGALNIPIIKGDTGATGAKGDKGDTGAAGYTPVRGTDYWTTEDQEAIVSEVESDVSDMLDNYVEKEEGKGLSTNDYDDTEKTKLSGIEAGAEVNIIETVKVNGTALTPSSKEVNVPVPTKTSDLTNDSGFGTYSKPSGGIPSTDMTSAVQTSLGKADTAVQNTDYASTSTGGVIKTSNSAGTTTSDGELLAQIKTYSNYTSASNNMFISKGTLENVLTEKIGNISSALDAINGEVV